MGLIVAGGTCGVSADGAVDAAAMAALEFLERSRDVANELVVDGRRGETSTSRREETAVPRSGPLV